MLYVSTSYTLCGYMVGKMYVGGWLYVDYTLLIKLNEDECLVLKYSLYSYNVESCLSKGPLQSLDSKSFN